MVAKITHLNWIPFTPPTGYVSIVVQILLECYASILLLVKVLKEEFEDTKGR